MALPEPEALETKVYIAPSNSTEEGVAKIWGEVLRRDRISTDDNFFELGGHSLLATQIVSRVREQFRVDLPIRAMFESPTICGLAEAITTAGKCSTEIQDSPIIRVSRDVYRSNRT
jgi:acyl carrier protein